MSAKTPKNTAAPQATNNQPLEQRQPRHAEKGSNSTPRTNNFAANNNGERRSFNRNNNANGDRPNSQGPRRRPNSDGGNRRTPRRGNSPVTTEFRSLHVNRVYTREFEGHNLTEQYKEVRFQYLRSLFEAFGPVEHFEYNTDRNSVVITFATHDAAKKALETLRVSEEKEKAVKNIQDKLALNKLPTSLSPNTRFYVDWEHKTVARNQTGGPKTVVANQANSQAHTRPKTVDAHAPKTVTATTAAPAAASTSASAPATTAAATEEHKENGTAAPKKEKKDNKKKKADVATTEAQPQSPSTLLIAADDLRREAERAKLRDELEYFKGHTSRLQQQITAEKERCTARDFNIAKLKEELERIQAETARIEGKLSNETEWKKTAEQRVVELQEELNHFQKEEERAESRLREFLSGKQ